MNQKSYMPIREFSRLSGIRRENLRFYDRIGLLTPEIRGENGYRYYSRRQLNAAYLICDLRELGMGLEEIRQYSDQRTPERMLALFAQQEAKIRAEIARLHTMRTIMAMRADMARQALDHGESALLLEERDQEPIYLCPPLTGDTDSDEAVLLSFHDAEAHGVNLGYPFCAVIAQSDFTSGRDRVSQYYFKVRQGNNAWKPAGRYAVLYRRNCLSQPEKLYPVLHDFLQAHNLRICGDLYAECPLDEVSTQDETQFCICLEARVTDISTRK